MDATIEQINKYFEQYGWRATYDAETRAWHSGFRGESSSFNIIMHLTENWLYFAVGPFGSAPKDPECEKRLHQHLLRLNNLINMSKFCLDEDGDVVLMVEVPRASLSYGLFEDALNALSYYADAHYKDLTQLSTDPEYRPAAFSLMISAANATKHKDKERGPN